MSHDEGLADRIAAALRQERAAELAARANPPPPRPTGPVPDWLFGPRHRELDAQRRAERDRDARPVNVPAPPTPVCPCCLRPMPVAEP